MKLAVIGATGFVGSAVVAEARRRDHEVERFNRSGTEDSTKLDLSDTSNVADAINAADTTIITVAGRDDYSAVIASHKTLIEAAPTGRVIVIGGAGALSAGDKLLLEDPEFPEDYLEESKSFVEILEAYKGSEGMNWAMAAPSPEIGPGVRTGEYRTALDEPAGGFVSVEDFAVALLDEAEQPQHNNRRFTVASADEDAARGK